MLVACQQKILEEASRSLEKKSRSLEEPISLGELYVVAIHLAKNKVLGKDGIPVEYYLATWNQVGSILMSILQKGLNEGRLHPKLTEGLIVLLAKLGDQLLVTNKRGLTLLNYALKNLTKIFQIFLSTMLQVFILENQHAFLPGRSIHTLLLLTNEILHKAKQALEDFILLKLDTIKAFDCLGWEFWYRLFQHLGFGPLFINMLRTTNASTSSTILLQGRVTEAFKLKRSVRQGYPLYPLIFLVAHCRKKCFT